MWVLYHFIPFTMCCMIHGIQVGSPRTLSSDAGWLADYSMSYILLKWLACHSQCTTLYHLFAKPVACRARLRMENNQDGAGPIASSAKLAPWFSRFWTS